MFNWTNNDTAIGLAASGAGDIPMFTAKNTTANPITANITVTPVQYTCMGTSTTFTITVNPTPMLTSTLTPPSICNFTVFNYFPSSGTLGTSFLWERDTLAGISNPGRINTDNPADSLINVSTSLINVPYVYTLSANGCSNKETISVNVYPTPELSVTAATVCSGSPFSYTASSTTLLPVTFTWTRTPVAGITPASNSGSTAAASETLTSSSTAPVNVTYFYTTTITGSGGCQNTQNVVVTVNPLPVLNGSPLTPAAICDGRAFNDSVFVPSSATAGTAYTWTRAAITGINGGLPGSGIGQPNEILNNSTPYPVNVAYAFILTANGCSNPQLINETVNPTPKLTTPLSLTICDNKVVDYPAASLTPLTTFLWVRNPIAGISTGINSNFGNPLLTDSALNNITVLPIVDTYYYTLTANGCPNLQKVAVTVNPKPTLSIPLTHAPICDSTVFNYAVASNTPGVSFAWFRPYIPGIYAAAQSGTGDPNQALYNSTYVTVDVVYDYYLTFDGCVDTQFVHVIVNPTPKLTSSLTNSVCSGSPFSYTPTSFTPGATFVWNRPAVTGITPGTNFGTGNVNETVTNLDLSPITVNYQYRLGIGACQNLYYQTVRVVVDPTPPAPGITTTTPASVCMNTLYQNFLGAPTGSNIDYTWSATNGIVFATGSNNQNALVNFYTAGSAVVTLSANVHGYNCYSKSSINVDVKNSQADFVPVVVYNNGQFICLQNNNDSYQWGYDNIATLASTVLSGQIDQNYVNGSPDFAHNRYWVITNTGGCMQKAYFDDPPSNTGISNLNDVTDLKVYPNPATDNISIEVVSNAIGKMQVEVVNMLGQRIAAQPLVNNKANIIVESFPAGNYLVSCYLDGVKVANAKFTKN